VSAEHEAALRVDKWLWYARFFKTRSLAARLCDGGKVRRNRVHVDKASRSVRPGDVLTFPQGHHIRVVKVLALGHRRGPVAEAQALYEDLSPPEAQPPPPPRTGARERGAGRPTKADRRALDALRREE
jgi:ribosome-associated heat shock protein Hsp15